MANVGSENNWKHQMFIYWNFLFNLKYVEVKKKFSNKMKKDYTNSDYVLYNQKRSIKMFVLFCHLVPGIQDE